MIIRLILFFLLLMLLFLGGYILFLEDKNSVKDQNITIPTIIIPKKSIEFRIEKSMGEEIYLFGVFSRKKIAKEINQLFLGEKVVEDIKINSKLKYNRDIMLLLNKILPIIHKNYTTWTIVYKDHKLLIDGVSSIENINERIDNILSCSKINSFNNTRIELIDRKDQELEVINALEKAIISDEEENSDITDNEIETIISDLAGVVVAKEEKSDAQAIIPKKSTKVKKKKKRKKLYKAKRPKKKEELKDKEKRYTVKKKSQETPESLVSKKSDTIPLSDAEYYQNLLKRNTPDEDILALPMVQTVDMDIEKKIDQGLVAPLKTPKPLVKKEAIVIPLEENKIDNSIPWAKLHDPDEILDGVVSDEVVASPNFKKEN